MGGHRIGNVKQMSLEIPFDARAVEVVAGGGEVQQAAARRIAGALARVCGSDVAVADDSGYAAWGIRPERHAILVGSLGDNRGIEFLYYRWLTFVDGSYPGSGGYVLTTVWDPWGTGHNALVVGAADEAGLDAAVARLEGVIAGAEAGIPGLYEVVYGSSRPKEVADVARWASVGPTPEGWVYDFTGYGGAFARSVGGVGIRAKWRRENRGGTETGTDGIVGNTRAAYARKPASPGILAGDDDVADRGDVSGVFRGRPAENRQVFLRCAGVARRGPEWRVEPRGCVGVAASEPPDAVRAGRAVRVDLF